MFKISFTLFVTITILILSQPSSIIFKPHNTAFDIMPKHASGSHLDSSSAKKRRVPDRSNNDFVPMDKEIENMSVREKLLAGVAIGFKKAQNQQQQQQGQQQQAAHNSQSYYEVATLQDSLDKELHVNTRILQSMNSPSQSQTMMFPAEEEEEYQESNHYDRKEIGIHHFCRRIDQRQNTSRRQQAVMRLANDAPFVPTGVPQASAQRGQGEGLRLFLHSACRKYGYRKLELDLLGFLHVKVSHDFRGEPLGSVPMPATAETGLRVRLDTKEGSLAMYESDVPDELGHVTTWLWLKICRTLTHNEQSKRFPGPDMPEDQEAWSIIAIPKSQVEMLHDEWFQRRATNGVTNGDSVMDGAASVQDTQGMRDQPKKRSVAMRYSRDGVPSLACSDEKGNVYRPWFNFRPDLNDSQWEVVDRAMATNSCLVHAFSKPGAGWVTVPPERPEQPKRSDVGGVRRSSRLKQEVHLED